MRPVPLNWCDSLTVAEISIREKSVRSSIACLLAAFVVAATTIALHSASDWSEQCAVHQNGDGVDFRLAFLCRSIKCSTHQISFIPGPVVNSEAVSTQLASCHGRVGHRAGKCKAGVRCTSVYEFTGLRPMPTTPPRPQLGPGLKPLGAILGRFGAMDGPSRALLNQTWALLGPS